jgi:pyruvate kinase
VVLAGRRTAHETKSSRQDHRHHRAGLVEPEVIERLFQCGADVFRINMSHATQATWPSGWASFAPSKPSTDRPIGMLVDLQGPKLRVGTFKADDVRLDPDDSFVLDDNPSPATSTRVHLPHPEIFASVRPGEHLLLNDGRIRLVVIESGLNRLETRVIFGGSLSSRKGVNLPDTVVPLAAHRQGPVRPRRACRSTWTGSPRASCSGRKTWPRCARC